MLKNQSCNSIVSHVSRRVNKKARVHYSLTVHVYLDKGCVIMKEMQLYVQKVQFQAIVNVGWWQNTHVYWHHRMQEILPGTSYVLQHDLCSMVVIIPTCNLDGHNGFQDAIVTSKLRWITYATIFLLKDRAAASIATTRLRLLYQHKWSIIRNYCIKIILILSHVDLTDFYSQKFNSGLSNGQLMNHIWLNELPNMSNKSL